MKYPNRDICTVLLTIGADSSHPDTSEFAIVLSDKLEESEYEYELTEKDMQSIRLHLRDFVGSRDFNPSKETHIHVRNMKTLI